MLLLDRMKRLDKHDRLSIRGFGRDADASIPGSGDSTDRNADGSDSLEAALKDIEKKTGPFPAVSQCSSVIFLLRKIERV